MPNFVLGAWSMEANNVEKTLAVKKEIEIRQTDK